MVWLRNIVRLRLVLVPMLLCAAGLSASGCGALARDVARDATPGVIAGAVEGVSAPGVQRDLADGIDPAAVELAAARISGNVLDGTLRAMADPSRRAALLAATEELRTPIASTVASAVDAAIVASLSRVDDEVVRTLTRSAVDEAIHTAFAAVGSELEALGASEQGIAETTREISKQATLGFQDALDEIRRERESGEMVEGEGSVLFAASKAAESGAVIFDAWRISLIVLALALLLGIGWAVHRARHHRKQLAQRDEALLRLTEQIEATTRSDAAGEPSVIRRVRQMPTNGANPGAAAASGRT